MDDMPPQPVSFTIGALAREAGVNVETVRYYQRRGLLREPHRPPNGVRRYSESDLLRLHLIKRAQRLRFSLSEIIDLLGCVENGNCPATKLLAQRKLQDIDDQLATLQEVRDRLHFMVTECCGGCAQPCLLIQGLHRTDFSFDLRSRNSAAR